MSFTMYSEPFLPSIHNLTGIKKIENIYSDVIIDTHLGTVLDKDRKPIFETLYNTLYWTYYEAGSHKPTIHGETMRNDDLRQAEVELRYQRLLKDIEKNCPKDDNDMDSFLPDEQVIYLITPTGFYPYGHLHDTLNRLYAWRDYIFPNPKVIASDFRRIIDFEQHIEALGFSADTVVDTRLGSRFIRVPKLYYGVNPSQHTTYTPENYDWLLEQYLGRFSNLVVEHTRSAGVYVDRNHVRAGTRSILNYQEVEEFLASKGFVKLTGEEPLEIIVQEMRKARNIVGCHGSFYANVIFCNPDARIIEYCPEGHPDQSFRKKHKQASDYQQYILPCDDDLNVTIDLDHLKSVLKKD